jgi:hypothetical protein
MEKIRTTVNPEVPLSQYDLAMIQFSFCGLLTLFPGAFGIHEKDGDGLRGFAHLWALFGHLLGLKDEFNVAIHPEDKNAFQEIFHKVFVVSFKILDSTGFRIWRSLYLGMGKYFHTFLIPFDSLVHFMIVTLYQIFPNSKKIESSYWIIMSLWARLCYYWHCLTFKFFLRCFAIRMILNVTARTLLYAGWFFYIRNEKEDPHRVSRETLQVKWSQSDGIEILGQSTTC